MKTHLGLCALVGALLVVAPRVETAGEVLVGMSAALSGPSAQLGRDMRIGVEAAFREATAAGGRMVQLRVLDDSYQEAPVRENVLRLIDTERVLAIVGSVGTPGATVSVPIVNERKVLFFGAFTGADVLRRNPPDRYVFNYRASYAEETQTMVRGLLRRGIKPQQIAFFTQDDGYGQSGYEGAIRALENVGYTQAKSLAHGRYARGTLDIDEGLLTVLNARTEPRAVIIVGTYGAAAKFIRLAKQSLPKALFLNVSFVGTSSLVETLGTTAEGVIIMQVVPHYDSELPGVQAFRRALARQAPGARPGFVTFEGYLVGKIFARALAMAGQNPTRESIVRAFEQLGTLDLGIGPPVRFGKDDHQGSHGVWATVVRGGVVVPTEW